MAGRVEPGVGDLIGHVGELGLPEGLQVVHQGHGGERFDSVLGGVAELVRSGTMVLSVGRVGSAMKGASRPSRMIAGLPSTKDAVDASA